MPYLLCVSFVGLPHLKHGAVGIGGLIIKHLKHILRNTVSSTAIVAFENCLELISKSGDAPEYVFFGRNYALTYDFTPMI